MDNTFFFPYCRDDEQFRKYMSLWLSSFNNFFTKKLTLSSSGISLLKNAISKLKKADLNKPQEILKIRAEILYELSNIADIVGSSPMTLEDCAFITKLLTPKDFNDKTHCIYCLSSYSSSYSRGSDIKLHYKNCIFSYPSQFA